MNKKEIAAALDGLKLGEHNPIGVLADAERSGVVVVVGYSDDNMELYGALRDEIGCWDGGTIYLNSAGQIEKPECECEYAEKWYANEIGGAKSIEARWCKDRDEKDRPISWTYKTEIPHETYKVLECESDEIYCIGIVFDLNDLEK